MLNVHTQPQLDEPGLGSGSQLTCRVGLVFPTKGSSTPSDTIISLNPNEHPYLPPCVALSPGCTSLLFLSLFSSKLLISSSHSIILFIA